MPERLWIASSGTLIKATMAPYPCLVGPGRKKSLTLLVNQSAGKPGLVFSVPSVGAITIIRNESSKTLISMGNVGILQAELLLLLLGSAPYTP